MSEEKNYPEEELYSEYGEIFDDTVIPEMPRSLRPSAAPVEAAAESVQAEVSLREAESEEDDCWMYSEYGGFIDSDPAEKARPSHGFNHAVDVPAPQPQHMVPLTEEQMQAKLAENARVSNSGNGNAGTPWASDPAVIAAAAAAAAAEKKEEPRKEKKQYTPVQAVGRRKGGFGRTLLFLIIALLLGFGGGLLSSSLMADHLERQLSENFEDILAEAGGAVLYRSVETNAVSGGSTIDAAAVTNVCADSVVEISTTVPVTAWGFFGITEQLEQGAGSGVILSESGYILTCYHVIEDAQTITVGLRNGNTYEATFVAGNKAEDVAIISIQPEEDLVVAVLGNSDAMNVGDDVVAIGNPLGQLGGTVTQGVLSAKEREVTFDGDTYTVMQTDAAINGGNSGGGLFNAKGELIGLVNGKTSSIGVEGLAFALPISRIQNVIEDLLDGGDGSGNAGGVTLGIVMVDIDSERTATSYRVDDLGCYILQVNEGSNAERAGLMAGDRILSINGTAIDNAQQVVDLIGKCKANDEITMTVERENREKTFTITLYGAQQDKAA